MTKMITRRSFTGQRLKSMSLPGLIPVNPW
ncbi:hypothetical protein E2C01_093651 [Portunus trituberculatus]|uniref:Uncharacterized protein n=1 Tax=Portunus trituberculatus TaxID=210409 RepID=A0A5B7JZA9_PORTR|nr:hypothetical protein [Portunus trituberculatus]